MSVNCIPIGRPRPVGIIRDRAHDDVKALGQKRQVNHCVPVDVIGPKHPRLPASLNLRDDDRCRSLNAGEIKSAAVVALGELWTTTGNVCSFRWEIAVRVLDAEYEFLENLPLAKAGCSLLPD